MVSWSQLDDWRRSALQNMNTNRAFCLILLLASVGCDSVTIDKPIGQRIDSSRTENVVGRWTDSENNIIELRLSKNQELVGGHLAWDEEVQRFTSKSGVLDVRTLDDKVYLFLTDEKESIFFRVELVNPNQMQLFIPEPSKFRDAVKAGEISGTITPKKNEHFDVRITADAKLASFLSADDWQKNYMSDPIIEYTRLAPKNKAEPSDGPKSRVGR
jgi:hypothetical protein